MAENRWGNWGLFSPSISGVMTLPSGPPCTDSEGSPAPGMAATPMQTPVTSVPVAARAEAPKKSGEQSHGQKKEADFGGP